MKKRATKKRIELALSTPTAESTQSASYRLAAELGRIVGKFMADEAINRENNRKLNLRKQE